MWILKTLVIFSFTVTLTNSFIQELTLYENPSPVDTKKNNHVSFQSQVAKLSLELSSNSAHHNNFNFSNVHRVCALGVWFAYPNENFGGKYMPFGSSTRASQACVNSSFPYLSFRHLGARDTEQSALSLYEYDEDSKEEEKWTGTEILVIEGGFSLVKNETIKILYFSITGPFPWLFFEDEDFTGKSFCFENFHIVNAWSVKDSLRLEKVGSVFQSCDLEALQEYKEKNYGTSREQKKTEL